MSYIDALILLPLLVGLVRGLMRGLVTELVAIMAVILGVAGAKLWGLQFSGYIHSLFQWSHQVCDVVAYGLLFLAITILLNLFGRAFTRLLKAIHLGWLNRLLGGIFGTLKWAIIVLTLVFLINKLDEQFEFIKPEFKRQSLTYQPAVESANACLSFIRGELR